MKKRKEGPIMSLSPKRAAAIVAAMTAVGTTAIAACSSSSNHSQPETSDAAAVTDATGTVQDEATTPAVGDGASTDGPSSITCGSMTCTAPSGGILPIPLSACCLPDNSCGASPNLSALGGAGAPPAGVDAGSVCLTLEAGTPDPSCPSQSVMGFALAGCCAAGTCGYDLSIIGLGCNSFSAFGGGVGAQMACSPGDGAAPPADAEADVQTTDAQTDSGTPLDAQADATDAQSPTDAQADGASVTDARADAADAH
jgi:hypothetical protein